VIPELEAIKRLFLDEWDPIGVAEFPEACDEYDSYALQVFTSLHNGARAESIADYLSWLERDHMGLTALSGRSQTIADKVIAIHNSLPAA
jgi:hypothetical protein